MKTAQELDAIRDVGLAAARAAGKVVAEGFGRPNSVRFKGDANLVTDYDHRSEAIVVETILSAFPGHRVLAEEGTIGGSHPDHLWIIDPIDGTTNFAHGFPSIAISIAYERYGRVEFAAILDPIHDELFSAVVGQGATLNGEAISVSTVDRLEKALVSTGFPYERELLPIALDEISRFTYAAQSVRRIGAAALELAYVAAGRLDGFWEVHLEPWDCAAAALLITEAGGTITDFHGRPFDHHEGHTLASNGRIHDAMIRVLAQEGPLS